MFVYHNATIVKVVRCSCTIALLLGKLDMFVYHSVPLGKCSWIYIAHNALIGKVVICSHIITPL